MSKRVLAVDWGERRIGLAYTDVLGIMAHPYGILQNDKEILSNIRQIVNDYEIEIIVFGLPLTMAGDEGDMALRVRKFAEIVSTSLPDIDIDFFDERLTSSQAASVMSRSINPCKGKKSEKSRKKSKMLPADDAVAATLLLETYMKSLSNS